MKIGVVGAGVVTAGSHLPVLVNMPGVTVDWICDRSATAAAALALLDLAPLTSTRPSLEPERSGALRDWHRCSTSYLGLALPVAVSAPAGAASRPPVLNGATVGSR